MTSENMNDELTRTGYGHLTQSWNLRKDRVAYRLSMKTRQEQEPLSWASFGRGNPRANSSKPPLTSLGALSRNQTVAPVKGGDTFGQDRGSAIHLSQSVETVPCSAVIEERNRIAGEIHDTLAQEFAGILLHLEAVNGLGASEQVCEYLARAKELAKCGLEDARRMLLGLRPKSLEGAHLSDALDQLAERFSLDCGIHCAFSLSGRPHELPEELENELYRVAQEALCNVRKHSRAASVSILLNYNFNGVVLAIKDNGRGFAIKKSQAGAHGFGLPTMCERANRLGGRVDINTGQGNGTEVRMSVPLPSKTSKERNNQ